MGRRRKRERKPGEPRTVKVARADGGKIVIIPGAWRRRRGEPVRPAVYVRIGEGFSDEFYEKHPKGSLFTWAIVKPPRYLRETEQHLTRVSGERIRAIVRPPTETDKRLRRNVARSRDELRERVNVSELTSRRRRDVPARIGGTFEVTFTDLAGRNRRHRTQAFSRTTVSGVSSLMPQEIDLYLSEASKGAARNVMDFESIGSDDVLSVEFIPPVLYRYTFDRTTGRAVGQKLAWRGQPGGDAGFTVRGR